LIINKKEKISRCFHICACLFRILNNPTTSIVWERELKFGLSTPKWLFKTLTFKFFFEVMAAFQCICLMKMILHTCWNYTTYCYNIFADDCDSLIALWFPTELACLFVLYFSLTLVLFPRCQDLKPWPTLILQFLQMFFFNSKIWNKWPCVMYQS